MDIEHISVSRKQVWDQCAQHYKFKYHLRLDSPEPEPFYFVYGKIIHKIAEDYVAARGEKKLGEVAIDVLDGKIPIERHESDIFAPSLPEDYKRRLPGHLQSIKTITEKIGYDGELEYPFNYDLEPPNNLFVKGFIDRLIKKDDQWFILDYKTTKPGMWRKDNKSIIHDLQLRIYAKVVQKHFNVPAENIRCALYYLEGGNLIAAQYNQHGLDSAEAELLQAHKEIQAADPDRVIGTVSDDCRRCPYRKLCSFYNNIKPW